MIVDVRKYIGVGRKLLQDEANEREQERARRAEEIRNDWEARLADAFALLPDELRPLVEYSSEHSYIDLHTRGIGYGYPNLPVLRLVDCAPISILCHPNSLPKFVAHKATLALDQDTLEPVITYREGNRYEDPMKAIAEAADFFADNTKVEAEYNQATAVPAPDCAKSDSCRYGIPDPNHESAWVINMPWGAEYVFNGRWADAATFADITCKSHWSYDPDEELTGAWTIREVRPGSTYGPYTAVTM